MVGSFVRAVTGRVGCRAPGPAVDSRSTVAERGTGWQGAGVRNPTASVAVSLLLGASLAGCGSDGASDDDVVPDAAVVRPTVYGGARPATLQTPGELEAGRTYPLTLVLHGYSANGFVQQAYLQLGDLAQAETRFVLAPDGTVDSNNRQFWNADPACCDFGNTGVDDVAYLGGLIDAVSADWPIDPKRIQVVGHSNGAFMAYRLACERADVISAIAALAGGAASTASTCTPSRPVNVLHIHGTMDETISYQAGGRGLGAVASATQWAGHDGCTGPRAAGARKDLDGSLAGTETQTESFGGCPAEGAVDLWTIEDGSHTPSWSSSWRPELLAWLAAHTR